MGVAGVEAAPDQLLQRSAEAGRPGNSLPDPAVVHSTASFSQVVQLCMSTHRGERHSSPSSLPQLPQKDRHWPSCAPELHPATLTLALLEGGLLQPLALLEWAPTQIHE